MNKINYIEHRGKVVEAGTQFEHVMAIALEPRTGYREGIVRCILSRDGDVSVSGYVDRSALYRAHGNSLEHFTIGDRIDIKNQDEVVKNLVEEGGDFIGLEDPDIWIDENTNLMHVYFTMPIKNKDEKNYSINLGHAVGPDINSLTMTELTLCDQGDGGAKEVSIAPLNSKGVRLNLVESSKKEKQFRYSTVRVAIAEDMGKPWVFGETLFNPEDHNIAWIGGHASPGPLLPKTFIDIGEHKLVGILNGREANTKVDGHTKYGMFSVGLFVYDYEEGKIDWVSPEPFIIDSEALTITFASQFVETEPGKGILYAHVDDSFIRAYNIDAEAIQQLLP